MQKKLLVLAIAGLSGAAFAQTNVSIYGVADATFDAIRVSGGAVNGPVDTKTNTPNFTRVSTNGSLIGLRGTENLGNGLNALFQFESDANFDTGGGLSLSRDSFVGLSGNFGKVLLGNLTGPTRALANRLDVNAGSDGISSNRALLGKLGGALANGKLLLATNVSNVNDWNSNGRSNDSSSVFDTRLKNSIAYVSPSFNGFQASAQYMANENKTEPASGDKSSISAYDVGANYDQGPVFLGVTYERFSSQNKGAGASVSGGVSGLGPLFGVTPLGLDEKLTELRVGGMYDFGVATVRALYARTKADVTGGDIKQNVWGIGGTYNVTTNGRLTAQYYHAGDLDISGPADDSNTGAKFFSIGYEHSLSKRTLLKANYAYLKNDDKTTTNGAGGYDFANSSSGFAGDEVKLSGLQLGIRHSF